MSDSKPFAWMATLLTAWVAAWLLPSIAHPITVSTNTNAPTMERTAAMSDIALARSALQELHAGYDRYIGRAELDRHWTAIEGMAHQGISREVLYLELSRLLAAIRCDHTKAELPEDLAQARLKERVYLPFRFVLFDDRMFVEVADKTSGLSRGDEILTIDAMEVAEWLSLIRPLVPVDGDADHTKNLAIAYTTEFMGGALDHFAPFVREVGPVADLRVLTDGRTREITADRLRYPDFLALTGEQRYGSNFAEAIRYRTIGDDAAYLAVDTFVNYRKPVDAMAVLQPLFARVATEGRDKLIVDLRQNGGGSDDAQAALLRHLIARPVQPIEAVWTRFDHIPDHLRPHLDTWEAAALHPDPSWFKKISRDYFRLDLPGATDTHLEPAKHAFIGELVMLTGPLNSSGATHLLATLRSAGIGTFVGGRTGGSPTGATAGILYFLTLPQSNIRIRIPATRTVMAHAASLPKRNGIEPDVLVLDDVDAFFNEQDAALQRAKQVLALEPDA